MEHLILSFRGERKRKERKIRQTRVHEREKLLSRNFSTDTSRLFLLRSKRKKRGGEEKEEREIHISGMQRAGSVSVKARQEIC